MELLTEEIMLIRYSCKDMGLNCPFVVKSETIDEVIRQALLHVQEKHANDFNSIKTPAEVEDMKKSLARSTRIVSS